MRLLKRDRNGIVLLLQACEDPARRKILGARYGPDEYNLVTISGGLPSMLHGWSLPFDTSIGLDLRNVKDPDDPRPELQQLLDYWDRSSDPIGLLIQETAPFRLQHMRFSLKGGKWKTAAEIEESLGRVSEASLAILREVSGRTDLESPEEWSEWFKAARPEPVSRHRWFELMLAHPALLEHPRLNSTYKMEHGIAPDLVPLSIRLARIAPQNARTDLAVTLLLYCDRVEEAPVLIDAIDQEIRDHPTFPGQRNAWPITILRERLRGQLLLGRACLAALVGGGTGESRPRAGRSCWINRSPRREDRDDLGLEAAGDVDLAVGVDEDVDLAPDAELGEVDARLDREAGPGQDEPLLVGLEVVHVGAVAVGLLADAVAGAVDERRAVAGLVDHPARGVVDLPAVERAARRRRRRATARDRRVAGAGDDLEDLGILPTGPSRRRTRRGSGRCRRRGAGRAWPRGRSGRSRPCGSACRASGSGS